MKKLNLDNYTVTVKDPKGIDRFVPYDFRVILVNLITHPKLGLNGPDLLEVAPLVEKIEKAGVEVILKEEEYRKMIDVLKRFNGFNKNDIQFVQRIYNCPDNPDDGSNVVKLSDN